MHKNIIVTFTELIGTKFCTDMCSPFLYHIIPKTLQPVQELVHHFGPDWNKCRIRGDIHSPQKTKPDDFGDPWFFTSNSMRFRFMVLNWNDSTTFGWIAMKCGTNIHAALRMKCFGDVLTFLSRAIIMSKCYIVHYICEQIPAKLITFLPISTHPIVFWAY